MINQAVRSVVRGAYDLQKLRIQTGLRLVATFKAKLGQSPGEKETELDSDAQKLIKDLRQSYERISDGVVRRSFKGDGLIDSLSEFALVGQYIRLDDAESSAFANLGKVLKTVPIYNHFLADVKGIGPAMAGVIVSEIDIAMARHPSSLWKYAGLDVAPNGAGRSRKSEHLVDVEYNAADGTRKSRKSITFNPFLKTKLVGVLGASFLRAGDNKYRQIYADYKHRLEHHAVHSEKTKGHRHNMAIRYMIKMFLLDLYVAWRTLEDLPVSVPYAEAKLGIKHAT